MNTEKWLKRNAGYLYSKTVAVTGTTGGIGKELCLILAKLGANLILLDRNPEKSAAFREQLVKSFKDIKVECITLELENILSVKAVADSLKDKNVDIFIHNAGAYSIPRHKCSTGLDNVFQINFASPYYIIREILPNLRAVGGRVVVVGSIAHNYSKTDPDDIDFSTRRKASKVYGNAKRYLMFSLFELFKNETKTSLSVVHPGITFTNITNHYPRLIFAIIKNPMKIIFMRPKKACLSIIRGVFKPCGYHEWIGPSLFDIWGYPKKKRLNTCSPSESLYIGKIAEKINKDICKKLY